MKSKVKRFDTPGRFSGSYDTLFVESVTADMIFRWMSSGVSVINIREAGFGSDFDILTKGLVRDFIRFAGAISN